MTTPLHIGVMAERRYMAQSQPAGLLDALRRRDVKVTLLEPERLGGSMTDDAWLAGIDLVVGRGRSWGMLTLLAWVESRGVPTINRNEAISAVHNKAEMSVVLAANCVPAPRTYFGSIDVLGESLPDDAFPAILKPIFGDNCRGLEIVPGRAALASLAWDEPVALAQPFLPTDGYDVKLYGIGQDVWAVRKPSPLEAASRGAKGASELLPLTPELEALGRRCGLLFGLELFGVDCIVTHDGPLVIEVNDYPNYTAVPEADERLADYVVRAADRGRAV
jgi:ribosomal protein S6--L-glutamate ligase